MDSEIDKVVDWTSSPSGAEEVSLWDCLHDGSLVQFTSDRMERTAVLRFAVEYVTEFNNLPEGMTFNFLLKGVQSLRSLRFAPWPGKVEVYAGLSREEQSRRVAEYQAKWREESEDWGKFEAAVNEGDAPEVADATLLSGSDNIALRLGLMMPDGSYRNVFARADAIEIRLSDGRLLNVPEFLAFGEAYWEAFAARQDEKENS